MLADGVPVGIAAVRPTSVLRTDHQFDNGSGISLTSLSTIQIANLAKLGKVWGFLKYHHPAITAGAHHWDYDLFRVLPQVLSAADNTAANAAISSWIANLGNIAACTAPCASLTTTDLYLSPNLNWIYDTASLGTDLSQKLSAIYINRYTSRTPADSQFFVSLIPNVLNPSFDNELSYQSLKLPDSGYQLLALFRFWNMVQYFYPNRDVIADSPANSTIAWDNALTASIPRLALAKDALTYQQELMRTIALLNDTHANLWSSLAARPPIGSCQLPVDLRFIEGSPVVIRYNSATAGPASGLLPGDVITQLDGVAVSDLVTQLRPFYADSNEAARLRDIANSLTQGACGGAAVTVIRGGATILVTTAARVNTSLLNTGARAGHDRPGDTFQLLSKDVAYLKIGTVVAANSQDYVQAAAGTKGLIIDIRNYPSEFVVFTLGALLNPVATPFVTFTNGDLNNPGAMYWGPTLSLSPGKTQYTGKVVILVDEITQSSAEYHAMAFRTAPGAIVLGSTTAGADGNVSTIPLPGGLSSLFSGIGVYYPDKRPTQRVGIVPDVVVSPTIAGIQAGRDELVEEAIRRILGGSLPAGPSVSSIQNAGDLQSETLSPGTWTAIFGQNFGDAGKWTDVNTQVVGGARVFFCGIPAVVSFNSGPVTANGTPTWQLNALVPAGVTLQTTCPVVVTAGGLASAPVSVSVSSGVMELFGIQSLAGPLPLITHANAGLIGPAITGLVPAKPNETVVAWGTGNCSTPVVTLAGSNALVTYSGSTVPGLCQVNFQVPKSAATGNNSLRLSTSPNLYTLWVSP